MPTNYFDQRIATSYETKWPELFEPAAIDQPVAFLAALAGSPSPRDHAFYTGKVAAASFFAHQVLPQIAAQRVIAEATDNALMDLPEDAF